jgi:hypothetical protein
MDSGDEAKYRDYFCFGWRKKDFPLGVGLDVTDQQIDYHYPPNNPGIEPDSGTEVSDNPSVGIDNSYARLTRNTDAVMYLMWKPQIDGSIEVPLGYVRWSIAGTAIHNLAARSWPVDRNSSVVKMDKPAYHINVDTPDNGNDLPTWTTQAYQR